MISSLSQPKQCHICQSSFNQSVFYSCTNTPICSKNYCISCIKSHFSTQSSPEQFKLSTWLCYSCQSKCQCSKCSNKKYGDSMLRFSLSDFNDAKPSKDEKIEKKIGNNKKNGIKKSIRFNVPDEAQQKQKVVEIFDLQQESQEYVTPSLLKEMQNPSKSSQYPRQTTTQQASLLEVFKQESMTPHDYSQELIIGSQRKSKTIIKCKKERNFVGLKVDKIPPYLQSIMKRKQVFKNFMERHSKKSYEQLVREENERVQQEKTLLGKEQRFDRIEIPSPVMKASPVNFNSNIDSFFTPVKVPQTPSFVPLSQPLTPIPKAGKISELLHEQLKQYQMEDDDLSIELL